MRSLILALCALPFAAAAEGNGLLVGDSARLHAFFETEARYDSLAALGGVGNAADPVFDPADLITHLRPGVRLDAPGSQVNFVGGARLDYELFTGLGGPTRNLSFLGAYADGTLEVARGGPVAFSLGEHFARTDQTSNPALGVGTITDSNTVDAHLTLRPGGGALEGGVGYQFGIEGYELHDLGNVACGGQPSCDGTKFPGFGSQSHRGLVELRWRFLPKTALLAESSWVARVYDNPALNVATSPLRASLGLVGLITEKVRVVLKGGYENTFAAAGSENFKGFIGQVELGWEPRETVKFAVGGLRTVEPVSDAYGWYDDFRAYASMSVLFLGRLLFTASGNLDSLTFANREARQDTQASATAALDYELNKLLRLGVGSVLTYRDSNDGGPFSYQRFEIFGKLNVSY